MTMILICAYIVAVLIYYIGESKTETMATATNGLDWDPDKYHTYREFVENMGRRFIFLLTSLLIMKDARGIALFLFTEILGLIVYEFLFRKVSNGSYFANVSHKVWGCKFFRFKRPHYGILIMLGLFSIVGLIYFV